MVWYSVEDHMDYHSIWKFYLSIWRKMATVLTQLENGIWVILRKSILQWEEDSIHILDTGQGEMIILIIPSKKEYVYDSILKLSRVSKGSFPYLLSDFRLKTAVHRMSIIVGIGEMKNTYTSIFVAYLNKPSLWLI